MDIIQRIEGSDKMCYHEAHSLFSYDPETGLLIRKTQNRYYKVGDPVNSKNTLGYITFSYRNVQYLAHRVIWLMVYGYWPTKPVDHVNQIPWDNRLNNLRISTKSQNAMNRGAVPGSKSGIKNVYWFEKNQTWVVKLIVGGQRVYIGSFKDLTKAKESADLARIKYHGEFASG